MAKARENQKMLGSSNLIDSEQIRIMCAPVHVAKDNPKSFIVGEW